MGGIDLGPMDHLEQDKNFLKSSEVKETMERLGLRLSPTELEYVTLVLFRASRDVSRLPTAELGRLVRELAAGANTSPAKKPDQDNNGEAEEIEEEVADKPAEKRHDEVQEEIDSVPLSQKLYPEDHPLREKEQQEDKPQEKHDEVEEESHERNRIPVSQSVPDEKSQNPLEPNVETLSEEQIIEVAQKCFGDIAELMKENGLSARDMFKDVLYKAEGEADELIEVGDFLKIVRGLGLEQLQDRDEQCLVKVLAATEDEKYIRLADFVQVIEDYGVSDQKKSHDAVGEAEAEGEAEQEPEQEQQEPEAEKAEDEAPEGEPEAEEPNPEGQEDQKESAVPEGESPEGHKFPLHIQELDSVSMVVMLALAEYLKKEKTTVHELFGPAIYKQMVKTKTKQKSLDILNSADFFRALHDIGIKTEDSEHENLRLFLCLDPSYPDKIHVKKLLKVLEQFATNEELRDYAHGCYQDLVSEEEPKSSEDA